MHVTLLDVQQLTSGALHCAFTSITRWRGAWYLAYREAQTHAILPAGVIRLWRSEDAQHWLPHATLSHGTARWPRFSSWRQRGKIEPLYDLTGDVRDPKLIASEEALYMICGTYLPKFQRTTLHERSTENIIQSHVSYTEDGEYWTPLQPVGRPGYWIWSAVPLKRSWVACAYHTGTATETSSLHLLSGTSLLELGPLAMLYDGSSHEHDGATLRYTHLSPSEPVLYQPAPETLACLVRTEKSMEIGVSQSPYQDWRLWDTKTLIHPSSVLSTPHGWLMAGREIETIGERRGATRYNCYTALWQINAQQVSERILRLPSAKDCAYAGLCEGATPNEYLVSWYSQHAVSTRFGTTLPSAHVFVARIRVDV